MIVLAWLVIGFFIYGIIMVVHHERHHAKKKRKP
jgi:hypothetical protein